MTKKNISRRCRKKTKQVLQQEAYLAIWRPVDGQNSAIPGAIPQIGEELSEMPYRRAKFHADW